MILPRPIPVLLSCLSWIALGACAHVPEARGADSREHRAAPVGEAALFDTDFVLVLLKTGPRGDEYTPEQRKELQAGHRANMIRLAEERKMFVAGPFGQPRHDPDWRGIFVFDVRSVEEAQALADTDPAAAAGVFVMDPIPMRAAGWLRGVLDLESEMIERAKGEGRVLEGSEQVRGYALLTADDAELAERALAPLFAEGRVALAGRLGGEHAGEGLYVLDFERVEDAERALALEEVGLGSYALDAWWATPNLAKLAGTHMPREAPIPP